MRQSKNLIQERYRTIDQNRRRAQFIDIPREHEPNSGIRGGQYNRIQYPLRHSPNRQFINPEENRFREKEQNYQSHNSRRNNRSRSRNRSPSPRSVSNIPRAYLHQNSSAERLQMCGELQLVENRTSHPPHAQMLTCPINSIREHHHRKLVCF